MRLRPLLNTLVLAATASACASNPPPDSEHPTELHDVTCQFVGLEAVQGHDDVNSDSVTLFAVYRFPGPMGPPAKEPMSLKFQVERSRVDELREHLMARPEVICSPDGESNYRAKVEPFEGIFGEPSPVSPLPPPIAAP